MTNLNEVTELMITKIPLEMRSEEMITSDLSKTGVIEMASALNFDELHFEEQIENVIDEETFEEKQNITYFVTPDLTFKQIKLAAYFAYGAYLQKLKLSYTNDAINFSTLTFSIKGLEKRPDAINDSIYYWNRYLPDEINKAIGSSGVLGTAVKFGGDE